MTSRTFEIALTPTQWDALQRSADVRGYIGLGELVEDLLETEAYRLLHIERCKPKGPKTPGKPGRPKKPEEEKRGISAYKTLKTLYEELYKTNPTTYGVRFADQWTRVQWLYDNSNWPELLEFLDTQPWLGI